MRGQRSHFKFSAVLRVMSLHNATSASQHSIHSFVPFPPGLSSVVRCLSRKRRLTTEDLMEVLSPACSGGVPRAEGSSVPVGKGGPTQREPWVPGPTPRRTRSPALGAPAPHRVPESLLKGDSLDGRALEAYKPRSRNKQPQHRSLLYVSWCGCWGLSWGAVAPPTALPPVSWGSSLDPSQHLEFCHSAKRGLREGYVCGPALRGVCHCPPTVPWP